ncbi:mucin-5AC [Peromyscus californicus insignis]|uniref:mucin-5AC n=1 Tax=Peromyscus californicus insignis TaxID=564181 RepID=UPI0022A72296|nr:mucin-5AC [Peromyscus californicus insignis]
MGVGRRKLVPFWVLALALACGQHTGQARQDTLKSNHEHHSDFSLLQGHDAAPFHGVTIISPQRTIPVVRALNPAHTGRVCSTWGNFHYKTFDGQVFRFPGLCNYVFSAHCGAAYEDFNIQLRRGRESNATTLSRVTMKLDGLVVDLTKSSILVNNHPVQLPFSQSGVLIELSSGYLKVVARLGLVFMWNDDDSLLLELDTKYINKTCGLCGDFNGSPESSEFLSHNVRLTPLEFGNLQKMDGPTEQCQDPLPVPQKNCSTRFGICEEILKGHLFSDCSALVDTSSYLEACRQDLCLCESPDLSSCVCHTLAEYSRQCAHAGGQPQDWRGPDLCSPTCPLNMQHQECGSPCVDTCSNLQRSQVCEDHCVAGCFCPEGTVLDDINQTGCVPVSQCACLYNGTAYAPGTNYSTDCTKCTCSGGQWSCQEVPCPGTCSVLGGSHFSTFDERQYTVHGDCSYVLSKPCDSNIFSVLAELRKCGLTDSETCLKSVTLSLGAGKTVVMVKATGEVFVNQIYTQLPVSTANVTLFRPSTFFIIAQTNLGLQLEIQLVPIMQVFVRLAPELRGLTCGLCGNFNSIQADDFQTISGVVEGTAAAFFNTFKTQAACPNVRNNFEDPCSLSVENEKYAQHWCSQLTDASGPFSQCHTTVNPSTYFSNCMFDTCNCEKSEDCMCAALSSYVRACAAKGVLLSGWRDGVCTKPTTTCPKSMTYQYHISTCQPTCRSLNEEDVTCHVSFIPVDGCTCPAGTFLDDSGKCVQATSCPCYHRGSTVPNGESIHDSGAICTCTQGTLTCIGGPAPTPVCDAPMIYFDCRNATPGDTGAGCQKSCHTLDMTCYSSECVPGCVCPHGLVADGNGGCVAAEDCPCVHNEATYRPGETIRVGCNNCTCENRMWQCTDKPCLATCAVYGDGHYLTFDGQRYSFSGNCEYTLLQDHCGGNGSSQDAFRVVTENIPCGTTGTTCSKDIKIFLGNYELKLSDGKVEVVQKGVGQEPPYYVHQMGIYLVVETDVGLVLLWDRKTSIFLRLSPEFKGRVCGLCGNFDDNAINDFTTRSQSVVGDVLEFGNSWKFSPSCPDAVVSKDPCTANPYRKSWAQKQCSIINSATFTACHAHVEPAKYYEACVSDACACDSGGDCECFCTAVAAYAQACHEVGVCVSWRTPDICPLFCDYYNPEGQCEWHYKPCGAPCMRTCQNPNGHCLHDLPGLEGCYPKCPPTAPIFDEGMMQCVRNCTATPSPPPPRPCRINGKLYRPGATVPSDKNCYSCICTENGVSCAHDAGACVCTYNGQHFHPGEIIYHTTDGTGGCISAHCRANGTIERTIEACSPTTPTPPTTFSFSTPVVMTSMPPSSTHPSPTLSVVYTGSPSRAVLTTSSMSSVKTPATASTLTASTMASTSTTPGCQECHWSPWMDVSHPGRGIDSGDFETLENLRAHGYQICQAPRAVECRAEETPEVPLHVLGQQVECSTTVGLTCHNRDQVSRLCDNYQIRIQCCTPISCPTSSGPTQTTHLITSRTAARGTTTSLTPVTSTDHTDSTVISGRSTHAPGPFPSSSHPSSSASSPTTPGPVSSTAIKVNLSTTGPMPQPTSATSSVSIPSSGSTTASFETTHECTQELCSWTDWIDGSYPGPDRNSGDFDTFKNLRSKGYKFCEKPRNVECRAQFFPNTPLEELGQNVICNREEGLICLNKNQLPPICYNYEIRIECCKIVDVCSTASATTHPASHEVSTKTKTNWTTSLHSSSTKDISTHSATEHTETWATDSPHTITQPGTTHCQPQCSWTKWFDTDFPVPGPHGGDLETYSNILRRGERICHRPEEITQLECRAENHPEMRVEDLGQVVQCDPTVGLVCRNRDQKDVSGMCLNYEVRVLCCRTPEGCPGTTLATLSSTSGETVTSSAPVTTSEHAEISTSTPRTRTTIVQTSSTTSTPQTSTTSVQTASTVPTRDTRTTSVQTASTTSMPKPRPTSGQPVSTTSKTQTSSPSRGKLSTTLKTQTRSTSIEKSRTTHCQPQCSWTKWFDTDFPVPGPHGGDLETYSNILRRGERICHRPEEITQLECRAENHPEMRVEDLGQVVQCDPTVGLVCRNRDQKDVSGMCLNYEVRVLCCRTPEGCPGTTLATLSSTSGTTHCQPQCSWTKWFDTDFPVPGPHGGDLETYSNILRRGERICHRPEEITQLECRAENHPEMRVEDLGQVVQCDPTVGLVCRNRDQKDVSGMCLNYEVRVLCCRTPEGCPGTTLATLSSTSGETVTSSAPVTTSVHEEISTSTPRTRTTIVQTSSTTFTPQTSTTSVQTASTMSTRDTRTTSVQTASTTSMPKPRPTSGQPVSTTSKPQTRTTPIGKSSTTSGQTASTMFTRSTSTTSGQTASTTYIPQTSSPSRGKLSTTLKTQTSSTSTEKSSTTSGQTASTMSTRDTRTTSVQTASTTSMPKPRPTSGQPVSTTSKPQTRTTPIGKSSTTSGQTASTMFTRSTSTTSWQTASMTFIGKTSTISVPGTRATSAPTSTTGPGSPSVVTSFPGTTHCQPECSWTKWFDTDFPVPGPHGGDLETYSNILRRGERICHRPEEITQLECRAENHPEMRVEDLGQVVQCDPTVGLVCRNRDQKDVSGMCLNYEVRVLCCRTPEGCPGTSATSPVTSSHKPSFPVVSPSSVSPSSSSSPRVHSATPCFCSVAGHLYPIGSIIYNQTDLDGHCYYAMCSQDCQVVRSVSQDCPSTTPSPTPALFTSTSTSTPVIHRDRCNVVPPRMKGDIWHMPNCSQATCEGNNVVSLSPRQCPEVKAPSCANGYPPLKVDDQDGCCQHYQCQCVCSGWGDPHYITFDGTYYTFLDNCTYVLVQQIVPVFGHFRVLIDNYFCDPGDSVSCPQSIIVEYHQDRVVLTRRPVDGIMTNQIIFNNKVVNPGFQQNGIIVSRVGIKMYVAIQEIGVQVMFSGLIFSVEVPFNMFSNNTEGQCGTCTNDKKDECRLPGGALTSCSKMAPHWKVPNQPSCQGPPPTSTSVVPSPSPTPCPPSPICELLLSNLFQSCHDIIPPLAFYEGCLFDSCHGLTLEVVCSALELYASLCAAQGRCIPWRSQTNNTCSFTCPDNKVYQPCGPTNPQYCYRNDDTSTSLTLQEAGPFTEGCFCPDNMTPFSTNDSICMPSCQWCLGPHGEPVEPGHTLSIGCEDCTCRKATLTCQRKPCPQTTCPEPGFVPVPEALEAGQCCPQFSCVCNSSHCPPPLHCPENSSLMVTYEEGTCCPSQTCSSRKGCEVNGTLYQPGAVISSSLCETCLCEAPSNFHSDVFVVNCETKLCSNIQCPQGFEYHVKPGQCCGQCIQKGCLVKNSNSSTYFYLPGESWPEPEDPCVTHKCEKLQDVFTIVTMKKECPKINCPPGHAQLREDGCCYDCLLPQQKCTVHQRQQIIRQQNCSSEGPVSLSYCQGNCGDSTSMYSLEANTVEHKCECCQELQTSQRSVTLRCDDGSSRTFSYTQVEKCGCLGQRCHALGDTSHPESAESEFKSKGSKEHGQQSAFRASEEVLGPSQ